MRPVAADRGTAAATEQEWLAAEEIDRRETSDAAKSQVGRAVGLVVPMAALSAAASTVLWWTPGFSASDTGTAIVVTAAVALLAVAIVPLTNRAARPIAGASVGDGLLCTAALASVGAAAIHFTVIGMHLEEYTLYGVFFVVCGHRPARLADLAPASAAAAAPHPRRSR